MTRHLINGKPYAVHEAEKQKRKEELRQAGVKPLEKIILITSKPFDTPTRRQDSATGEYYTDTEATYGNMSFVGHRKDYEKCIIWLKEIDMYDRLDEVYIFDRYHKNGDDMVEKVIPMNHEFMQKIVIKEKYKHCWMGGTVYGGHLEPKYALDPLNERFDL